jgi:hypothetical protein
MWKPAVANGLFEMASAIDRQLVQGDAPAEALLGELQVRLQPVIEAIASLPHGAASAPVAASAVNDMTR